MSSVDATFPKVNNKLVGGFIPHQLHSHLMLLALVGDRTITSILHQLITGYVDNGTDKVEICDVLAKKALQQWDDLLITNNASAWSETKRASQWDAYVQKCVLHLKNKKIAVEDIAQIINILTKLQEGANSP